jgi:hypothetical protein
VPGHSLDGTGGAPLAVEHRTQLLEVASRSIEHGLGTGLPLPVDPRNHPQPLRERSACFVTLRRTGALRGCIGELEAHRSLVESVADRAFQAAFRDPRFASLRAEELHDLEIHVAILGPLAPLAVRDERELWEQLEPGVDGVTLTEGAARATFLPAVWEKLPEPRRFLAELKRKAGLPQDHWSDQVAISRYQVFEFSGRYRRGEDSPA